MDAAQSIISMEAGDGPRCGRALSWPRQVRPGWPMASRNSARRGSFSVNAMNSIALVFRKRGRKAILKVGARIAAADYRIRVREGLIQVLHGDGWFDHRHAVLHDRGDKAVG